MVSSPRLGKLKRCSGPTALFLLVTGCAAAQAHADPGSRIDRERELRARFSEQYRCAEEDVAVSGSGTTFDVNGCGKRAQYMCQSIQGDAKEPHRGCSERTREKPLVPGSPGEQPPVFPGGKYEPLPGPPGRTH